MKRKLLALLLSFTLLFTLAGCTQKTNQESKPASSTAQQAADLVPVEDLKLTIGSAPGPVTYPLAQMAEQNSDIILKPWQSSEQLISMVTAKEVQLCSTPINNAILSYNKGLDVKLLMVTVWGMLYVMSTDPDIKSLQDLKGKEVALTGQGGIHDLIFRHLLIKNKINPDKDLTLSYMDMPETSSRLASGQIKYAILNEPHSSVATLNAKKSGVQLHRVLDLTQEWNKLPGQEKARLPMAGMIVVNDSGVSPEQIAAFEKLYISTSEWVNSHPEEIGPIVEKHVPWMKAPAVSQSLKFSRLNPQHAADCQAEIEAFLKELSQTTEARVFGGKIPDAKFYYQSK